MQLANRLGTAILGFATDIRIENGAPVCTLITDSFTTPAVAQFANTGSIRALLQQSDTRSDETRVVAVIPEESDRYVRASPIIIGTLDWPTGDSIDALQIPRIESPDNNLVIEVTNSKANITNTGAGRELTPVLRADATRSRIDALVDAIGHLTDAIRATAAATNAPGAPEASLNQILVTATQDSDESDSLHIT